MFVSKLHFMQPKGAGIARYRLDCMLVSRRIFLKFYIHGSVHRESNLIIVQKDANVPTQQRERMAVDPVDQCQKL